MLEATRHPQFNMQRMREVQKNVKEMLKSYPHTEDMERSEKLFTELEVVQKNICAACVYTDNPLTSLSEDYIKEMYISLDDLLIKQSEFNIFSPIKTSRGTVWKISTTTDLGSATVVDIFSEEQNRKIEEERKKKVEEEWKKKRQEEEELRAFEDGLGEELDRMELEDAQSSLRKSSNKSPPKANKTRDPTGEYSDTKIENFASKIQDNRDIRKAIRDNRKRQRRMRK